jgi:hypothetical protein
MTDKKPNPKDANISRIRAVLANKRPPNITEARWKAIQKQIKKNGISKRPY